MLLQKTTNSGFYKLILENNYIILLFVKLSHWLRNITFLNKGALCNFTSVIKIHCLHTKIVKIKFNFRLFIIDRYIYQVKKANSQYILEVLTYMGK